MFHIFLTDLQLHVVRLVVALKKDAVQILRGKALAQGGLVRLDLLCSSLAETMRLMDVSTQEETIATVLHLLPSPASP